MTEQIYSEASRKIILNKKIIEAALNVKLATKDNIIFITGEADMEFIGLQVVEAVNLGFSISQALALKEEGFIFQKLPIKPIARRNDLTQVRARVIGTERKALDTIENLTDTRIALHQSTVGVIGKLENVDKAVYVLKRIIAGSNHSKMYAWLENKRAEEREEI